MDLSENGKSSESASEAGMDKRPAIKLVKLGNCGCPSKVFILPTSYQNAPGLGFSSVLNYMLKLEGGRLVKA